MRTFVCVVVLIGVTVVVSRTAFFTPGPPLDEGRLLVLPERILAGARPIADFECVYPPGNDWLLAAVYAAIHPSVRVERTVGLAYRLALVLGVFAVARRTSLVAATGGALLALAMMRPLGLPAYAWFGGLALAVWGAALAPVAAGAAGLLSALATSFRWDLAPAVALAAAVLMPRLDAAARRRWLAGVALGVVPWFALAWDVGPSTVVTRLVLDPMRWVGPGRRLPLPPADPDARGLFVMLLGAAATLAAMLVACLRRRRGNAGDAALLAAAALAIGIVPQALQRADWNHLVDVGCATIALLPVGFSVLLRLPAPASVALVGAALALVAPGIVLPTVRDHPRPVLGPPHAIRAIHGGRSFPVPSRAEARTVQALLDDLDRRAWPGARVFVGPRDLRRTNYNDVYLYFLVPRYAPASYHLEMMPGGANRPGSRFARDLKGADFLLLTDRYDGWSEPNASARLGPEQPMRVVRRRFCRLATHGTYELLGRCRRGAIRTTQGGGTSPD